MQEQSKDKMEKCSCQMVMTQSLFSKTKGDDGSHLPGFETERPLDGACRKQRMNNNLKVCTCKKNSRINRIECENNNNTNFIQDNFPFVLGSEREVYHNFNYYDYDHGTINIVDLMNNLAFGGNPHEKLFHQM